MNLRRGSGLHGAPSIAVGVLLALSVGLTGPAAHAQTITTGSEMAPTTAVTAWGNNDLGQTDVPAGLDDAVAIAAGGYHSLALRSDGTVTAWGSNASGRTDVPAGLDDVVAVAAGGEHSLALRSDGTVTAWGYSFDGQTDVPVGLDDAVAVAAGGYHSLALRSDGTVTAWGDNAFGQTDVPAGLDDVVAISGGRDHSVALRFDGTVTAWGDNSHGQTDVPADIDDAVAVAGGGWHSLALRSDGTVTAWGMSFFGLTDVPADLDDTVAIAAAVYHSLALRADGTVTAWGNNAAGQADVPAGLDDVIAISAGGMQSVALVDLSPPPDDPDPDPVDPDPGPVVGVCPAPSATPAFGDVPADNVHVYSIDCAAYHEIALGYPDGTYGPANGVRRDQMASFIVRTLETAGHRLPAPTHTFTDIAGNTHERAIGQLAAADIVRGRTPSDYAPARTVTRDQMASYLVRALDWALDTTHTTPASPFTDIAGNTHEQAIHTAYDLELTTGRTPTTYGPRMDVRRDQMASFLIRLLTQAMTTN
jgi:hypothetical protein